MVSVSANLPRDMVAELDAMVDDSNVYESRSHLIRVAIREYRESESEFSKAA